MARDRLNQIDVRSTYTARTPPSGTSLLALVGSALSTGGTVSDTGPVGSNSILLIEFDIARSVILILVLAVSAW